MIHNSCNVCQLFTHSRDRFIGTESEVLDKCLSISSKLKQAYDIYQDLFLRILTQRRK